MNLEFCIGQNLIFAGERPHLEMRGSWSSLMTLIHTYSRDLRWWNCLELCSTILLFTLRSFQWVNFEAFTIDNFGIHWQDNEQRFHLSSKHPLMYDKAQKSCRKTKDQLRNVNWLCGRVIPKKKLRTARWQATPLALRSLLFNFRRCNNRLLAIGKKGGVTIKP